MSDYVFSIGSKAGGDETVNIVSKSGSGTFWTLTLAANVPATVKVGDKLIDNNGTGVTFLVVGPEVGATRAITTGTTLNVDNTVVGIAPFNVASGTGPVTGNAKIRRAFISPNVASATDGTTGSFERGTRMVGAGIGSNTITGELWESCSQANGLFLFGCLGVTAAFRRKLTTAPGMRWKDQANKNTAALRVGGILAVPVVTVTAVAAEGWIKPCVENYSEMYDLCIALQNVNNTAMFQDGGANANFHDNVISVTFSGTGRTLIKAQGGDHSNYYRNVIYVSGSSGTQSVLLTNIVNVNTYHENTIFVDTDVTGSVHFTDGVAFGGSFSYFTNNIVLAKCNAGQAATNSGTSNVIDYNVYCAAADDTDYGTHFSRIDGVTAGQLFSDILRGTTIGNEDGRITSNSLVKNKGDNATGTVNTTDILGNTYASSPNRSPGASEYVVSAFSASFAITLDSMTQSLPMTYSALSLKIDETIPTLANKTVDVRVWKEARPGFARGAEKDTSFSMAIGAGGQVTLATPGCLAAGATNGSTGWLECTNNAGTVTDITGLIAAGPVLFKPGP